LFDVVEGLAAIVRGPGRLVIKDLSVTVARNIARDVVRGVARVLR
jgi:hypothetical protein